MATYAEALVVFRDLLDNDGLDNPNVGEYARGGINLIADLFGIVGVDVGTRMEQVENDLRGIPMFVNPTELYLYGIKEYVHDPKDSQL